ncbi:peptidoglycan-binding protein [Clostridia bacterium]|nr:peptidoglycan-binding protein [Clostridia bacterium]
MSGINPQLTSQGTLICSVYDGSEGKPVSGAHVYVRPRGDRIAAGEELTSNSSGNTETIDLAAPPVEFSLDETNTARPYSEYDLTIDAQGFNPVNIEGVQILPGEESIQNVILDREYEDENIWIGENTLYGDYPEKIPEDDVKILPEAGGFVVLPEPVIPEYVIVHAGPPASKTADYWVRFKDYIKNVGSSEIYSTWPDATIRANILAIISFTLNRVYTEWYRAKGYNFTITNSTAYDHAYFHGRNIFDKISQVVDEMFSTYITKPNIKQPLLTQYCDGRQVSCPNWMTQWGSKSLGDQGYSAVNILKYYYGYDIYLTEAKKVEGVPSSFPGVTLRRGSSGKNVRVVQEELNAIAKNYPLIPKVKADGIFGPGTENAVKVFQQVFKLPQDGLVGFNTWYKLSDIYTAVTRIAELR